MKGLGCPSSVGRQEKDGSLRVCSDVCADVDQYLPNTEDLFATLAGGQKTKLARLIYLTPISRLSWMKILHQIGNASFTTNSCFLLFSYFVFNSIYV